MKNNFLLLLLIFLSGSVIFFLAPSTFDIENNEVAKEKNHVKNPNTFINENIPTFDIVRITSKGDAVIAGRSKPNKSVFIFDGNQKLGEVRTDSNGEWVWTSETPLKHGVKRLHLLLIQENTDNLKSDQTIIVFLEKNKTQTPIIYKSSNINDRVSKLMNLEKLERGFSVDLVEYSPEGKILLSGRSIKNKELTFYFNGVKFGTTQSNVDGFWNFRTENEVEFGKIDLKIEFLLKNEIISIKSPIFNEKLKSLSKLMDDENNFIVQPGNSLWRIARRTMGGGIYFAEIYKKNKIKINNPNLIFPGQVFKIPIITEKIMYER